jgi:hypothetical protein
MCPCCSSILHNRVLLHDPTSNSPNIASITQHQFTHMPVSTGSSRCFPYSPVLFPVFPSFPESSFVFCGDLGGEQLINSASDGTPSHMPHIVTDPVDDSLPPSGEESSHIEPEQPQDVEETHFSDVRQVVITRMCHGCSFCTISMMLGSYSCIWSYFGSPADPGWLLRDCASRRRSMADNQQTCTRRCGCSRME